MEITRQRASCTTGVEIISFYKYLRSVLDNQLKCKEAALFKNPFSVQLFLILFIDVFIHFLATKSDIIVKICLKIRGEKDESEFLGNQRAQWTNLSPSYLPSGPQ